MSPAGDGRAKIKNTKAIGVDSPSRIAETAARLAELEWIRVPVEVDSSKAFARRHACDIKRDASKGRRRP